MDGQRAIVFNIQKFSLNDGPGIRTVVFLKGCPLRCAWCANPESQLRRPQLEWDAGKCRRCGTCARLCGDGTIRLDGERVVLDASRAGEHPECVEACPGEPSSWWAASGMWMTCCACASRTCRFTSRAKAA